MTKLVVDSSVAVKWFVNEPYSTEANRILNDYQAGIIDFLAPDLIYSEFGNIIWKKQVFQGLDATDAQAILASFLKITFTPTSSSDLLDDAYRIAVTQKRTVYDALYLTLSVREHCPFVTADEKFYNAVHASFSDVIWLANWP
jgi:predicted nucleic acid-binding protein